MTMAELETANDGLLDDDQLYFLIKLVKSLIYFNVEVKLNSESRCIELYFYNETMDEYINVTFYSTHQYNTPIIVSICSTGIINKWKFDYNVDVELVKKTVESIGFLVDNKTVGLYRHSF